MLGESILIFRDVQGMTTCNLRVVIYPIVVSCLQEIVERMTTRYRYV